MDNKIWTHVGDEVVCAGDLVQVEGFRTRRGDNFLWMVEIYLVVDVNRARTLLAFGTFHSQEIAMQVAMLFVVTTRAENVDMKWRYL